MTNRANNLGNRPINQIKFPGAHDADSSQIVGDSTVCTGAVSPWAVVADLLGIADVFSNSQGVDGTLPALATSGIRFFDLRVCFFSNEFYGSHGFISDPIFENKLLGGLADFAKAHPQELIFVRFQSQGIAVENEAVAKRFALKLQSMFEDMLIPSTALEPTATLNSVLRQGNVIAIWDLDSVPTQPFWPGGWMPYSWPNATNIQTVFDRELAALKTRNPNEFFVSYMDLTPNLIYILGNLSSSLVDMEKAMNTATIAWFSNLPNSIKSQFNIIAFDAVLFDPALVDAIIQSNDSPRKLRGR